MLNLTPDQQQLLVMALIGFCARHPERVDDALAALEPGAGAVLLEAAQDLKARLLDVQSRLPALLQAVADLAAALPAQVKS